MLTLTDFLAFMTVEEVYDDVKTKKKIIDMLKSTRTSLKYSSGFNKKFYSDADVQDAFRNAIKAAKEVKILLDAKSESASEDAKWLLQFLSEKDKGTEDTDIGNLTNTESNVGKIESFTINDNLKELLNKIQIRKVSRNNEIQHWLISDKKNARLEQKHRVGMHNNKNLLLYNMEKPVAEVIDEKFDKWWSKAEDVDMSSIYKQNSINNDKKEALVATSES